MWTSNKMIALYIALGAGLAAAITYLVMRKTLRTRLKMKRTLQADPDINDWLIVFGWTPKVLYVPTMAASALACILMFLKEAGLWLFSSINPELIGGVWFAIFLLNLFVEEYNITLKILFIAFVGIGFLLLWLHLLGWVVGFLGLFRHLALSVSGTGYLLVTLIGLLTIGVSWLKGLFYYATVTPNGVNLQQGPTETGEQISREDYSTRVDTDDFLERLLGFGKIIITFKDQKKQPIVLLVWRISKKVQMLESVRAKFAIDYPQPVKPAQSPT